MLGPVPELDVVLVGLDLDGFVSGSGQIIHPVAGDIIDAFSTYSEYSPSGNGIKLFGAVQLNEADRLAQLAGKTQTGASRSRVAFVRGEHNEIAFDLGSRYYATTNLHVKGTPTTVNLIDLDTVEWLLTHVGPSYLSGRSVQVKRQDVSGSAHAFRFVLNELRQGMPAEDVLAKLAQDDTAAGEWYARSGERQHTRVVENAKLSLDLQSTDLDNVFDPRKNYVAANAVTHRLNKRHAVVVVGGQTKVATFQHDGIGLGQERDLHALYANDLVPTADSKRSEPASKLWMRDPQRRTYRNGMVFLPGQDPPIGTLNLYTGLSTVASSNASCARLLNHLLHVICAGDRTSYEYLVGYLSHLIQRPFEKPGVALVLRGAKGAGKDTLVDYLARLIGQQYVRQVAHPDHVTGKFNAHLETALILNLQEGFWAGSHKQESTLKHLITSAQVEIERKGVDLATKPSYLRIIITANADWVVPASSDERRYAVFSVSGDRCGDKEYFDALRAEMEDEGPSALLHHLSSYDLSAFNVRRPPATKGLVEQKIQSLRNIERWWFESLWSSDLGELDQDWERRSVTIPREMLRLSYESWMAGRRHDGEIVSPDKFGERLRKMVAVGESRPRKGESRFWCYVIPEVTSAREQFETFIGGTPDWNI